jgi:hypothetical protein
VYEKKMNEKEGRKKRVVKTGAREGRRNSTRRE